MQQDNDVGGECGGIHVLIIAQEGIPVSGQERTWLACAGSV
jgi:hypothetical protein